MAELKNIKLDFELRRLTGEISPPGVKLDKDALTASILRQLAEKQEELEEKLQQHINPRAND